MRSSVFVVGAFVVVGGFIACGSSDDGSGFGDKVPSNGTGGTSGGTLAGDKPKGPCEGLECLQVDCTGGATTTVSGIVTAPNGTLPLSSGMSAQKKRSMHSFRRAVSIVASAMTGGFANGGSAKSKRSKSGSAFASRFVSAGSLNLVSMNRVMLV